MAPIIGDPIIAASIVFCDDEMSTTSENPVQNKVVTASVDDVKDNLFTVAGAEPSSETNKLWLQTGGDIVELAEMSDLEEIKNMVGAPMVVDTVAEMTDIERVYVYTGSETGYTSGNWYYYDGTAWVSGGVYNAVAVETDATLTQQGEAADAKAVGDALTQVSNALTDIDNRVDILEALEKGRGFTPEQLQTIAASGHATEYFDIGDIIYIDWTDYTPATPVTYHVPHVVTHFGEIEDENGVKHQNAMYLMWMYATPQTIQFDKPEEIIADEETFQDGYYYYIKNADNSFTEQTVTVGDPIPSGTTYYKHVRTGMAGRLRYGSNDWSQSAYRQWLNSAGGKGEWWTAQHDSDVAPDQATTVPGFLTGYSSDWLAIFKPIKVQTSLNTVCDGGVTVTTYDKFFLPSLEQMYGSPQASGVEGEYWEYWKNELGLDAPTNGSSSNTNDARKIPSITAPSGAAVYVRLRSAYRSYTNFVWFVYPAGYLSANSASNAYRAQPACVIY